MTTIDDNAVIDTSLSESVAVTEVTESVVVTEVSESAVVTEVTEVTEVSESAVVTEVTESVVVTEVTEVTEVSESAVVTEVTESVVVTEVTESVVVPEVTESAVVPEPVKVKKIVFAIPGDNFSSKFLIAWTATISRLWETRRYDIMISPATGSFVPFVRMSSLGLDVLRGEDQKPFDGQHFDIWITIDSDIVFTYEQIINLIESTDEHPVVAGMYRMADLINFAFVKNWDETYFKEKGTFQFIKPEEIEAWKKETDFKYFPVVYSGMGFMAVRKDVFDKLKYPFFDSELVTITKEDGTIIRDICSEDVSFCKKITQAGFQIMINTDIRVGHIKSLVI